jgi:hypothetical protein
MSKKRNVIDPTDIEIDGKIYNLRLDLTAMKDFEDTTGQGVLQFLKPIFGAIREGMQTAQDNESIRNAGLSVFERLIECDAIKASDLQALFWACVGGPDSELSLRDAGRLVHLGNVREVAMKLFDAVKSALPKTLPSDSTEEGSDSGNAEASTG